ncbi:AAA family ATPase [Companilactobacillus sp. HBUAS59699]|uniref:AAA family ATPase n=1 Tax=Companilactobacillus sp. HBUAS59699 TaxID=3109358 RepID=UPI002FF19429
MKKKDIIDLIRFHFENNDIQFRNTSINMARYFDSIGDSQLSQYIIGLISTTNNFVPQGTVFESKFLRKVDDEEPSPLPLPKSISEDIQGVINAVNHHVGVNKFLLEGAPGTGKTETVKQIARLLRRQLYTVELSQLVDSKLGQTPKNIVEVFNEINKAPRPDRIIVLFDEFDAIALDRMNDNDSREMGRVTSTVLKELDILNPEILLMGTTNLYSNFDRAITRRFDKVISFDRYSEDDLVSIAVSILENQLKFFKDAGRDMKLFKKIVKLINPIPSPGELKNDIKIALAFSDPSNKYDYLNRLLKDAVKKNGDFDLYELHDLGFTLREMEILTGISKSQISRELRG